MSIQFPVSRSKSTWGGVAAVTANDADPENDPITLLSRSLPYPQILKSIDAHLPRTRTMDASGF